MKKTLLLLFTMTLILAVGQSNASSHYTFHGTVNESQYEGKTVYLYDEASYSHKKINIALDSAIVTNGTFSFSDTIGEPRFLLVMLKSDSTQLYMYFAPEAGDIYGNLIDNSLYGTPLNNQLGLYQQTQQKLSDEYYRLAKDTTDEAIAQKDSIGKALFNLLFNIYDRNKTNILGAHFLPELIANAIYVDVENPVKTIHSYLEGAAPIVLNNRRVKRMLKVVDNIENSVEGKHYLDITLTEFATGKEVMLSQFVEGKIALIDFWASWCKPCMEEIPYIANIHQKYGKEVVVIGLNVWDKPDPCAQTIEKMNMNWTILSDSTRKGTDAYGIASIPQILLIGADGTILKRDLRSEGIEVAVKEALNK